MLLITSVLTEFSHPARLVDLLDGPEDVKIGQ
jgi:hypothetical protein